MTKFKLKGYHITPVFCFFIYLFVFLSSYIKAGEEYSVNRFLIMLVVQLMIFVIPAIIYKRIQGPINYRELGVAPFRASGLILAVCAAITMFSAAVLMGLDSRADAGGFSVDLSQISLPGILYVVVIYCLLPAIFEEITFRSVIYGEYRKFGIPGAVLLSSVLFALMHFSLSGFFTYFTCGVVLALVYEVTRSIFVSMIVHFIYNLLSVFSYRILNDAAEKADSLIPFIFVFASLLLLFLFFSLSRAQRLLELYAQTIPESENGEYPKLTERLRALLISVVSPGFVLCIGFAFIAGIMKIRQ